MKNTQIKYRQWMGTEWRYWGFIDGIFVAPIQGIEDSYQLLPFTDKNGNEIWEGDFIRYDYGNPIRRDIPYPKIREVGFVDGVFCLLKDNFHYEGDLNTPIKNKIKEVEVIGNIYEGE